MFSPNSEAFTLARDCNAVIIPTGEPVTLPEGSVGMITQSLGGSYTVYIEGNLFRIAGPDADALGKEPETPPVLPEGADDEAVEDVIWEQLRACYDPEIPINVVDLGLIYRCDIELNANNERTVEIDMTLTAPGCGMGDILVEDVRSKVARVPTVGFVTVDLVFDPPWDRSMMSQDALLQTGMMY
ncbi:MAG: putative Fe-S cluster assembly protein SufT [Pseudomonadota bacterium]